MGNLSGSSLLLFQLYHDGTSMEQKTITVINVNDTHLSKEADILAKEGGRIQHTNRSSTYKEKTKSHIWRKTDKTTS